MSIQFLLHYHESNIFLRKILFIYSFLSFISDHVRYILVFCSTPLNIDYAAPYSSYHRYTISLCLFSTDMGLL